MKVIKLKTNINCGDCIASVTPFLNAIRYENKKIIELLGDKADYLLNHTCTALLRGRNVASYSRCVFG